MSCTMNRKQMLDCVILLLFFFFSNKNNKMSKLTKFKPVMAIQLFYI